MQFPDPSVPTLASRMNYCESPARTTARPPFLATIFANRLFANRSPTTHCHKDEGQVAPCSLSAAAVCGLAPIVTSALSFWASPITNRTIASRQSLLLQFPRLILPTPTDRYAFHICFPSHANSPFSVHPILYRLQLRLPLGY